MDPQLHVQDAEAKALFYSQDSGYAKGDGGRLVRWDRTDEEREANARLIAAAPELLHNCREAMQALSVVRDHFDNEGETEMVHDLETEIRCLALVITKATGGAE